jgi:hypothetical protein
MSFSIGNPVYTENDKIERRKSEKIATTLFVVFAIFAIYAKFYPFNEVNAAEEPQEIYVTAQKR